VSGRTSRRIPARRPIGAPAAIALALCILLAWSTTPAGANSASPLVTSLESTLSSFGGDVAVIVSDPRRGTSFRHAPDEVFRSASLYKLAVMVETYRQAAEGRISLDQIIVVEDWDLGDGGEETPAGTILDVRDAIERMITISDNSSAHALLDLLGISGDTTTSASDIEQLLTGLVTGATVSPAASAEMLAVLARQQINDRLPAGLPDGTPVAHKTGNLFGIAHDAGVIQTAFGPRVVVVLTAGFDDYADVVALMAQIAHAALTLPFETFAAAVTVTDLSSASPGGVLTGTVAVTNNSTFAWAGGFNLASHWRDASFGYVRWDGERAALPPLLPGQSAIVTYRTLVPASREPMGVLELDVVHEGVAWTGAPLRVVVIFSR
jgi:beta-lactamase class A